MGRRGEVEKGLYTWRLLVPTHRIRIKKGEESAALLSLSAVNCRPVRHFWTPCTR